MIVFLRNLLAVMGLYLCRPTRFFMDAMAAIMALKRGHMSARTKHIDVKFRWMADLPKRLIAEYIQLRSADITSDLLTKVTSLAW